MVGALKECVLQPQSELEKVRAFLLEEGFFFLEEDMVEEDGKYYPMMKVRPPGREKTGDMADAPGTRGIRADGDGNRPARDGRWTETELRYGRLLLESRHPVLREYLQREIRIREEILGGMREGRSARADERIRELKKELACAGKGMEYYAVQ